MNKIIKAFIWIAFHSGLAWVLWMGFERGIAGAYNVAVFAIWFMFIASLLTLSEKVRKHKSESTHPIPRWLNTAFDIGVVVFLAWHGHPIMAAAYVVHMLLLAAYFDARNGNAQHEDGALSEEAKLRKEEAKRAQLDRDVLLFGVSFEVEGRRVHPADVKVRRRGSAPLEFRVPKDA